MTVAGIRAGCAADQVLLTGEAPVFAQVIRERARAERAARRALADDPELEAVADGERGPFFADRDDRRQPTCACSSARGAGRAGGLPSPGR